MDLTCFVANWFFSLFLLQPTATDKYIAPDSTDTKQPLSISSPSQQSKSTEKKKKSKEKEKKNKNKNKKDTSEEEGDGGSDSSPWEDEHSPGKDPSSAFEHK